ncbi:hypothetical protein H310_00563 [Aphanomyces invadans]|uniref:Rieske domain-containing protein n=1 Tax=Aphanomyces invadans TaxID=157072 RepID=A0A024UWY6_9STRA|nr:hypothetical protein H310_00563 [Aphanomyces invadans]ETW10198.1 hypothetical protein H310_00563 [Aphanomyces invadans]|eukprot:XP_008861609.1 hypothetical protein H310_00563 [Aphanomyces invadans]
MTLPRVIASLQSLRELPPSKAVKFPWKSKVDGFVFLSKRGTPIAFANRCTHVALELDLNDADFFSRGVVQCKVHGAMFDPESGLCLRPPPHCKLLHPLRSIPLEVHGDDVLLTECDPQSFQPNSYDEAYRRSKQAQLQAAINADAMEIQAEIEAINERSLRLLGMAKKSPSMTSITTKRHK